MLEIPFADSGCLKYYENDQSFHYSYAINTFDYPTMHGHVDYWEFCIVTQGRIRNDILGKGSEFYGENTLSFLTSKEKHAFFKVSPTLRYFNLSVRESHLESLLQVISPSLRERLLEGPRCFSVSGALVEQVEALLHQCNLLGDEQREQKNGLLCSVFLLMLQELNRIHQNVRTDPSPFVGKLLPITERKEFVRYTVADLKRELNYSSAHLNRLFREHFDLTPHEYLQRSKFRYARNLLQNTDVSISAIAAEIGYSNLSHFFRNFKRYYGITPKQCRGGKYT